MASLDVLDDNSWVVTDPPGRGLVRDVTSLMARFSEGDDHTKRRAMTERVIAGLDIDTLRRRAHALTVAVIAESDGRCDLMADVARRVPLTAIAEQLVAADVDAGRAVDAAIELCWAVTPGGPLGPADGESSDGGAACRVLLDALAPGRNTPDDEVVARIALLFQTCDATAGLIGNSLRLDGLEAHDGTLARTLVERPPVVTTRRRRDDEEAVVELVGESAFGAGRHACPGREAAMALAGGVLDAVREAGEAGGSVIIDPDDEDRPNLRIPVSATLVAG